LVVRRTGEDVAWTEGRDSWWDEALAGQPESCPTEETDADDPYMVIYTSGTTGRPKGAVHVHAGFPIKAAHDLAYCFDLQEDDVLFWLTDLGWMMGPWAIGGGLMLGATLLLFEGTPDFPAPDRLWRLVDDHRVTTLGVAPTAIRALMAQGTDWVRRRDLSSLRVLGSTGETWNPGPWRWYFEEVGGGRCPIINYSGGTETGGGIVGCTTIQPQKPCAFTGPVPGMDADVVDDAARPVRGAVGELVVRQPWVGMTRGFWRDSPRYLETYWSRFPDVWVHGDWAEIDEDGFWFIRGRSDDTLKVAGKRVGPAEVESAATAHPAVREAAAIGVPHEVKGEEVVVFAVLRPGHEATPALGDEVRRTVAARLGAALRPAAVRFVGDLPKTRNAKIMRRVIRAAYLGQPPGDTSALENPAAVSEIVAARPGETG
ncbi:MAG: AMP-binding protein, partial [Chloroflexota bacterium]|nr:AMP-binding protein [Chloroflexota bacterium]